MALYKDFQVDGGVITLNMDKVDAAFHKSEALWILDGKGDFVKLSLDGDKPEVECKSPKKEVTVKVDGPDWLAGLTAEIIDRAYKEAEIDLDIKIDIEK